MKKNNNGFSLVELIIVIAIMAVLVGVLAPQFIKYVEQSRRSRDIQAAQEIREACLADIADGLITGGSSSKTVSANTFSSITEDVSVVGNSTAVAHGTRFVAEYNATTGVCVVKAGAYDLTNDLEASAYKTVS